MSAPRYDSYRESGVEWLDRVPSHWRVVTLRHLTDCCDGQRVPLNAAERAERPGAVPYWGANAIMGYVDQALFNEELVLLGEDGAPFFDRTRPVAFRSLGPVWPNNHIHVLRPRPEQSAIFLAYALNVTEYAPFIDGSTRDKLTQASMLSIPIAVPPPAEQAAIAAFLDRETGKIDALVEAQTRLIELLKEKRQAVISHAVTKGLDPDAPMKDSGVEWLGQVPAHWEVKAIKMISPVWRGASPRPIDDPKYFDEQGEYCWVRIADVSASDGILHATPQRLSNLGSSLSVKLEPGSLFVSIAGTVGKPCITATKACIHDGFVYFPHLGAEADFLYRIFEGGSCYGGLGKMGTQLNLNTDTVGSIRIALPGREEMTAICRHLDHETARMDALIVQAEAATALLQERRAALISAAVTGKIDVRGLAPDQAEAA